MINSNYFSRRVIHYIIILCFAVVNYKVSLELKKGARHNNKLRWISKACLLRRRVLLLKSHLTKELFLYQNGIKFSILDFLSSSTLSHPNSLKSYPYQL
jgi:hypothetical protein